MLKRITSHLLIGLAVFVLTATLFVWTVDNRVVNSEALSGELRKAGVMEEIYKLLPDVFSNDQEDASLEEIAEIRRAISDAVTLEYVDSKITATTDSVITFIRDGEPDPVIDLSDFPDRVRATGVNVDQEFEESFAKPVQLNESGNLDNVSSGYIVFSNLRYVGLVIFALLLLAEWFVAERGQKLKRISRVFLYAGLWFLLYWGLLILLPKVFGDDLRSSVVSEGFDASSLVESVIVAVQGLFSVYFLTFALSCLAVATALYLVRHYRHGDVIKDIPSK